MTDCKMKVTLGGLPQKIHFITRDERNPVILFLHGGPGVCNRHTILKDHADLLDTFTLVGWDQRGTGGSFSGARKETLTVRQVTDDAAELAEWLCKRFGKKKIFLVGGSWGSALGSCVAARYPQHVAAYVGFGQFVDGPENERLSYEFAMNAAVKAGDEKSIGILRGIGAPVKGIYKGGFDGMMAQRRVMMKYGGYSQNSKKRSYWDSMVKPMLASREYSLSDLVGVIRGYKYVLSVMWPEVAGMVMTDICKDYRVPYFIFDGRLDQNTPASLVQAYYETISAPVKDLIWFEHSGHNPMGDEPDRFKGLLREKLGAIAREEDGV